ncbi:MAG: hypothetical protein H7Y43_02360 [Akkermansiaceae bacterium]|nr:hypothetical protein [Verrucomicrobiales bacterium]
MKTDQAAEHLQTIRTLMERSALYRRALAPVMTLNGIVGMVGGIGGWLLKINSTRGFVLFWCGLALAALAGSFLLVRRQAMKDSEPFWSPPTRRVSEALLPALFVGAFLSLVLAYRFETPEGDIQLVSVMMWAWFYGCAICSAGFFMPRGIKLLGWFFIIAGCCVLGWLLSASEARSCPPHLVMGVVFGGLHLAYGIYLYLTEKRKNAA